MRTAIEILILAIAVVVLTVNWGSSAPSQAACVKVKP